jgi:hypothetical protein
MKIIKNSPSIFLHTLILLISLIFLFNTYRVILEQANILLFILLGLIPFLLILHSLITLFMIIKKYDFYKKNRYLIKASNIGVIIIAISLISIFTLLAFTRGEFQIAIALIGYFIISFEMLLLLVILICIKSVSIYLKTKLINNQKQSKYGTNSNLD